MTPEDLTEWFRTQAELAKDRTEQARKEYFEHKTVEDWGWWREAAAKENELLRIASSLVELGVMPDVNG